MSPSIPRIIPNKGRPRGRPQRRVSAAVPLAVAVAVAVSLTCPAHAVAAVASSISGQVVGIGGKCLDNSGGRTVNGNPVVLSTCNGSTEQQWTLPGDGTIQNRGYCLAVQHAGVTAMTPVWLYKCDGGPAQLWEVTSNHTLVNPNSGLCLADSHSVTTDGNPIWVYPCDAGPAQLWQVPSLAADPSGQAMPVGNLPGWTQIFADNFTENVPVGSFPAAVSSKWTGYPNGWHDTSGNGTYEPTRVVSIQKGVMNLYLHTQNGIHMVSAPEPVIPGAPGREGGLLYGRYAMRFKADQVSGYKTAWLLWPDSENWADGEIDFPEGNLTGTIGAFLHHKGDPAAQEVYPTTDTYATWHTAVIEWTPQSVTFSLDGQVIGTSTNTAIIPDTPMHWVLQTETQLTGGPPSNSAAGNVQIDWVTAYTHN
jgi:Ricin-type beta-trefoil lectin domain/Glycosyl hydrolases family 16